MLTCCVLRPMEVHNHDSWARSDIFPGQQLDTPPPARSLSLLGNGFHVTRSPDHVLTSSQAGGHLTQTSHSLQLLFQQCAVMAEHEPHRK
jgi:hypothetical protein